MTRALLAIGCLGLGCSGDSAAPRPPAGAPGDAATDSVASLGPYDPASQDDGSQLRAKPRTARTIDIMLRSSPTGAGVYVGAEYVGTTPTIWSGEPATAPVDFLFVKPNHAPARYKFIPITSGLVHGRLEPLAVHSRDAGLEPLIAPTLAPDASVPPLPVDRRLPPDAGPLVEPGSARGPLPPADAAP